MALLRFCPVAPPILGQFFCSPSRPVGCSMPWKCWTAHTFTLRLGWHEIRRRCKGPLVDTSIPGTGQRSQNTVWQVESKFDQVFGMGSICVGFMFRIRPIVMTLTDHTPMQCPWPKSHLPSLVDLAHWLVDKSKEAPPLMQFLLCLPVDSLNNHTSSHWLQYSWLVSPMFPVCSIILAEYLKLLMLNP